MSQQRGTTTNQLSNVLQVLQMGRKSGVLYVERDGEKGLEAGSMTFTQGHITDAQFGQHRGQKALTFLSTWGNCRFLFSNNIVEGTTQGLPALVPGPNPGFGIGVKRTEQGQQRTGASDAPQRLQQIEEALQRLEAVGLSRAHRRLLLLVDGQRGLPELARLMNRRENEVGQILQDLAELGLIRRM